MADRIPGAKIEETWPGSGQYVYFCAACGVDHIVSVKEKNSLGAIWKWNGDFVYPTFSPSCLGQRYNDKNILIWRCHHRISVGSIHYYKDSTHQLAGKVERMIPRE